MLEKIKNNKWWIYQKERFPFSQYIPMILAFSFCAISYSSTLRGGQITISSYIVSFITTFFFFALLRVADEFKDYEEDCKYRPYRAVPRGLVKLKELNVIGAILMLVQFALALIYNRFSIIVLSIVWLYFLLMCKEFFVSKWLKAHPTIYLLTHMGIMPLIDLYATSCDWLGFPITKTLFIGLVCYFVSSFCDGTVVEVGRKIRAEEDEEFGVETYTALWGKKKAVSVWLICLTVSFISTAVAGFQVGVGIPLTILLIVFYIWGLVISYNFLKEPTSKHAKIFETMSGIWMIVMYLALGLMPLI